MSKSGIKQLKNRANKDGLQKLNAKTSKETFLRIFTYIKPYKVRFIFALFCMIFSAVANVGGTFFISIAVDKYIVPLSQGSTDVTMAGFYGLVGIMAGLYLLGAGMGYIYSYIILKTTTKILRDIRVQMFNTMQTLPVKYFDTNANGDIMSRFTSDTDTLREFMSSSIPNIVSNLLTVVGVFVMMLVLSPILTALIVVMLFIILIVLKYIAGKSAKHFLRQQQNIGVINGYVEEHIEGMKVVKVFSREGHEREDFDTLNHNVRMSSKKAQTYANMMMPIMGNISYINYALTATLGAVLAIFSVGGMTLGKLISFLQYSRQFSHPLSMIGQQINAIMVALAGAERIFKLIDEVPEVDEGYVTLVNAVEDSEGNVTETDQKTGIWAWKHYHKDLDTTTFEKWQGEVELEDVSFRYVEDKPVLKHINMTAEPGQKIALVGSTGAGKTTITNLVNRFYDISDGKIRYDGINIKKIKKDDLRRSMAMVLQDTHLFTGTIKENICFGKLDATEEQVISAAKLANAHSFIMHLPQGYDTFITGDGDNLSQGQRQLLSIARAAVSDPPVLILDEATSSIDTRTEKLIEKGMDSLMQGRTVFVIAHRLSTVRNSDKIMVIENGEIIESGNHDELINKQGRYYKLYTGAFELD